MDLKSKALLFMMIFSVSVLSNQTFAWEELIKCNNKAVLDEYFSKFQLVIRDPQVVNYLQRDGLEYVNSKKEVIVTFDKFEISNDQFVARKFDFNNFRNIPVIKKITYNFSNGYFSYDIYLASTPNEGEWSIVKRIGGTSFHHCTWLK